MSKEKIKRLEGDCESDELTDCFAALAIGWFRQQNWTPFPFQIKTWKAFLDGKHGLLNAPTGSGKTYALWIPIMLQYIK
ncbi:MAG TPA: DEAD/DEAH box helicase, partial [Flavobacteriaceae bacterium]|nr:DEAD/DEAH box helicase [Flavobacteriaceae bacterium]